MKKIFLVLLTIFSINIFGIELLNDKKEVVKYENIVSNTKAGIISYMALWCPHCIEELKELNKFQKIKKNVDIILIFTDKRMKDAGYNNGIDDVLKYMKDNNYNFKIYYDYKDEFLIKNKISSVPAQSFIQNGKLKKAYESSVTIDDLQYIFRRY